MTTLQSPAAVDARVDAEDGGLVVEVPECDSDQQVKGGGLQPPPWKIRISGRSVGLDAVPGSWGSDLDDLGLFPNSGKNEHPTALRARVVRARKVGRA